MIMLMSLISIISNAVYYVILNVQIYTDRAMMPNGEYRTWHRSPVARLNLAGNDWVMYIQVFLMAVSIITSVLVLLGVKNNLLRTVQFVSLAASTVMFFIIMFITINSHAKYA